MTEDPGLQAFEFESSELLEELENNLLMLEDNPGDKEIIDSIFRAAHTIKGSSGLVGLDEVEKFTHGVENLLENIRKGNITVTPDLVELLLESRDHMAHIISLGIKGQSVDDDLRLIGGALERRINMHLGLEAAAEPEQEEEVVEEEEVSSGKAVKSGNWHLSLRFGPDVFRNGMDPASFIAYLDEVGEVVSITTILDSMPPLERMVHDICYLGFEIDLKSSATRQEIEDVFEFVQDDCTLRIIPPRAVIDKYIALINDLPEDTEMLGDMLVQGGALTPFELLEALKHQMKEPVAQRRKPIGEILLEENVVPDKVLDAALEKQRAVRDSKTQDSLWTIRVDTRKLDALINLVGEMVISGANVMQHAQRFKDIGLQSSVSTMSRLIEDIRERAMEVRMIPIHNTLNRYHRVVRDISHASGKDIELSIVGGETEIDRNVIEKIKDPLMHIIRNSADHGIEDAGARAAAGKPKKGHIEIRAYQETGDVVIEVSDDGGGLDRELILKKAIEKGLVSPDEDIDDADVINLITKAGFSTAKKITNVSGRGVGMDVVRRNIEALRGSLEVESKKGEGTLIRIRLPLTLAIIDGLLVGVMDEFYVVPLDMVFECIELNDKVREGSHGRDYINLRGEVLPYIRLRSFFEIDDAPADGLESIVVVRYGKHSVGLVVDRLYGEIQAVIKSLGKVYEAVDGISAATILGDGKVALIVDVARLVTSALAREESEVNAVRDASLKEEWVEDTDS